MKKTVVLFAVFAMVAVAGLSAQTVEISYLHGFTGPDRPYMENLIQKFNETHANIVVKPQSQPWGTTWQQLAPLVASGKAPDIVVINEDQVTGFAARGALTELTTSELKTVKIDKAKFYGPLWATADYEGKSYGVPIHSVALAMYYNKDLLKKAGISTVPKTRDDFLKAAIACTVDKNGKHPNESGFDAANVVTWGTGVVNGWMGGTIAYGVLRQNGVDLVDKNLNAAFNDADSVEAIQFLVDLVYRYRVAAPNGTEGSEIAAFRQGKVAFNFNGVWMLEQYKGQEGLSFGIAPFPRLGTKMDAAWGGSSHLTLPKQKVGYPAAKRAAALTFVAWITQPENNLYWTQAGGLPTQPAVAADKSFDNSMVSGLFEGLPNVYATSGYPWVGQVRGAWDAAIEASVLGKKTVREALSDGVIEANKQIDQARKALQ
ncbi:MAG: ABC transporter substrate-binding protein [Rectinemataceae bacterium]